MDSVDSNVFEVIAKLRSEYSKLLIDALKEGLQAIEKAKNSGCYIGKYYDFPSLSFRKNRLPSLSSLHMNGPIEYRSCFSSLGSEPPH